jgi:hypothetical protein
VRVKVVGEVTVKGRVPFADTGRDRPVLLSVMLAVSALVEAQDRFTELPGITQ